MSGPDLRKFMNILNESFGAPVVEAEVTPLTSVDEDYYVYAWESAEDQNVFDLWWELFQTNAPMTAEQMNVPAEFVAALTPVPAGTLQKFYGKKPNPNSDRNAEIFEDMVENLRNYGKFWDPDAVAEEAVFEDETLEETGNANAQQKGIHFSGKPANKNKGDMDLSSPKSTAAGSKTPLAQTKSGTNVGKIKS